MQRAHVVLDWGGEWPEAWSRLAMGDQESQTERGQEEQAIRGYKVRWSDEVFLTLVENLLTRRLGFKPQRWHLEAHYRHTRDRLGHPITYTWVLIHAKHNGRWRYCYVSRKELRELFDVTMAVTKNCSKIPWTPPQGKQQRVEKGRQTTRRPSEGIAFL